MSRVLHIECFDCGLDTECSRDTWYSIGGACPRCESDDIEVSGDYGPDDDDDDFWLCYACDSQNSAEHDGDECGTCGTSRKFNEFHEIL